MIVYSSLENLNKILQSHKSLSKKVDTDWFDPNPRSITGKSGRVKLTIEISRVFERHLRNEASEEDIVPPTSAQSAPDPP